MGLCKWSFTNYADKLFYDHLPTPSWKKWSEGLLGPVQWAFVQWVGPNAELVFLKLCFYSYFVSSFPR